MALNFIIQVRVEQFFLKTLSTLSLNIFLTGYQLSTTGANHAAEISHSKSTCLDNLSKCLLYISVRIISPFRKLFWVAIRSLRRP